MGTAYTSMAMNLATPGQQLAIDPLPRDVDVLVIGGGVIGVTSAWYLAQRGRTVTLVDKDDVCAGSSYGNSGLLVPSHSRPLAAPGVLAQGLRWLLDSASPFYVKPRLDRDLLAWLWKFRGACTAENVRRAVPVLRHDRSRRQGCGRAVQGRHRAG